LKLIFFLLVASVFAGAGGPLAAQYTPIPTLQPPMPGFTFRSPSCSCLLNPVEQPVFVSKPA